MEHLCQSDQERQGSRGKGIVKKRWFTFGQIHAHSVNGVTFDKDCVVEIEAADPREKMFQTFGPKWSMEYDQPPDLRHFPRGIIKLS